MSDGSKVPLGALAGAIIVLLFVSSLGGGGMMGIMGSMMSVNSGSSIRHAIG